VDNGIEDEAVRAKQGAEGQRQGRILRLTEEALEQGGVLTHEDLARALSVDVRTIRRDVKALKAEGHLVQTRGMIKGVGRGQTHKVKIIELWLDRQGYDTIERWVRHSAQSIKRYVSAFLRVSSLHQQGVAEEEIAFLTGTSLRLVKDYIELYKAALETPHQREKLEEELVRVAPQAGDEGEKTAEGAR
jgi:transcription initiation factor IIE alpha subunit